MPKSESITKIKIFIKAMSAANEKKIDKMEYHAII